MTQELLILQKQIDLAVSTVLYDRPCSAASLAEDWLARNAHWEYRDGAFWGRNPHPA